MIVPVGKKRGSISPVRRDMVILTVKIHYCPHWRRAVLFRY